MRDFNVLLGRDNCRRWDFKHLCLMVILFLLVSVLCLQRESVVKSEKSAVPAVKPLLKLRPGYISMNYQNIQVRSVLQSIADFSGKNMMIGEHVSGSMSLKLHELRWEKALELVLLMEGLEKRTIGDVILIDKIPSASDLQSDKPAQRVAQMKAVFIQLNNAKAADIATMLRDRDNSPLSEHGRLMVDSRTNTLWIRDQATYLEEITRWVKRLDKVGRQVLIEARVVSMLKNASDDLGVRFKLVELKKPETTTMLGQKELVTGAPLLDRLNIDLGALPLEASPATIGIALAKLNNDVLLDLELSALESQGRAEVIARPRLMTMDRRSAVIQAGEDIPYQESNLNGATSVAFKKAVLSLRVTPQITEHGSLLMALVINQDSDSGRRVQGVPVIFTKSLQTNVLVRHGETIVLGGIYKQNTNHAIEQVPFLGHLPVIGYLFRRKQDTIRHEELLIFITPRIMGLKNEELGVA